MDHATEMFMINIKSYLEKNRMTQRELANLIGVTDVTMSRYINGIRVPRMDVLLKISKIMGVKKDDLFEEIDFDTYQGNTISDVTRDNLRAMISDALIEITDNVAIYNDNGGSRYNADKTLRLIREVTRVLDSI